MPTTLITQCAEGIAQHWGSPSFLTAYDTTEMPKVLQKFSSSASAVRSYPNEKHQDSHRNTSWVIMIHGQAALFS